MTRAHNIRSGALLWKARHKLDGFYFSFHINGNYQATYTAAGISEYCHEFHNKMHKGIHA